MEIKLPDKKSLIFLIIVTVFALAVIFIIVYCTYFKSTPMETPLIPSITDEEAKVKRQLEEVNRLREEAKTNPPTEEQIAQQKSELDKLRKESKSSPLTEEQTKSQQEELDRLRQDARGR